MYRKTGFVRVPDAIILIDTSLRLIELLGGDLDREIGIAVRSLSKTDNMRLNNFFFERLLSFSHPKIEADQTLRARFIHMMAYVLREMGYISTAPCYVDYVTDPAVTASDVIELMIATRLPKHSASEMNNEFATIDTFAAYLPEIIRRYAILAHERENLTSRFFTWVGTIGWKVLNGAPLDQSERTALVMYSSRQPGTLGYIPDSDPAVVTPTESADPLVLEAGSLYKTVGLTGPFSNHIKIASDKVYERLTMWLGMHQADARICRGHIMNYGPFLTLNLTPHETVQWTLEGQLDGLTSVTSYFTGRRPDASSFSVRVPHIIAERDNKGLVGVYPDDPAFRLTLTDKRDSSQFTFEYLSQRNQRWLNSVAVSGIPELALTEWGVNNSTGGACQVEAPTLEGFGLMKLTERADAKVSIYKDTNRMEEKFLLPTATGLAEVSIDVTALGARFGSVETRPAFTEFMEVPLKSFTEPAPLIVDYVSSVYGLTADERARFSTAIAIYHNTERFERLTGRPAPLNRRRLVEAMLKAD